MDASQEGVRDFVFLYYLHTSINKALKKGVFCISLDFEKYWGVHDVRLIGSVEEMKNTEAAVTGILELFDRYETHATWATVGLLGSEGLANIEVQQYDIIPYVNPKFSPFPLSIEKYGSFDARLLIGKREIQAILNQKNQELASHTFSHFYCCEEGVSISDFELDCKRMAELGNRLNHRFTSIVFPRNQVSAGALSVLSQLQFTAYRGNQENRYWKNSSFEEESFFKKMMRFLDAYFKLSKTKAYKISELQRVEGVLNIPANRFLRPHSGKRWREIRKIKRIKKEMLKAAKKRTVYHLWWHPHNFNSHLSDCLQQLEELLAYQHVLDEKYGFESLNMSEIQAHAKS